MNSVEITTIVLSILLIPFFLLLPFRSEISRFFSKNLERTPIKSERTPFKSERTPFKSERTPIKSETEKSRDPFKFKGSRSRKRLKPKK